MKPFKLTVAYEVFEFVDHQSRLDRQAINRAFLSLRESTDDRKDLTQRDPNGRDVFVYLKGKFAIKFSSDAWEREVKVIDVRPRDP
jgi:hypothetical protein